jgi:hypothetical protein
MAIPSRQIGWGTESNLLWQILKQLTRLTSTLFSLKEAATPKYKVYTALLTQSGGDDPDSFNGGELIVGTSYQLQSPSIDADFTNVGAPNNNDGTWFIATGTTPNNWGSGTVYCNYGAPVATVLENTIGNIWFNYVDTGYYNILSDFLFIENKTLSFIGTVNDNISVVGIFEIFTNTTSQIQLLSFDMNPTLINGQLYNTPIEIRVYNL